MLLLLLGSLVSCGLTYSLRPPAGRVMQRMTQQSLYIARAVAAEPETDSTLGEVAASTASGLLVIAPERRGEAKVGTMLAFSGGATGVILFERCGYYFAASLSGAFPAKSECVELLPTNLSIARWEEGSAWGGVFNYLMSDAGSADSSAALLARADEHDATAVFGQPVPAAGRRPIGSSLHTGVLAIDALTPIGRGQSMALFGPNGVSAYPSQSLPFYHPDRPAFFNKPDASNLLLPPHTRRAVCRTA